MKFTFHHVGVAVSDLAEAAQSFKASFGYHIADGPYDDPIQKVSVCFLSHGGADTVLELVAPLSADSPINRTLKKGGGTYHVCYSVSDIRAAIAHLTDTGAMLLSGPVPAVAFHMRDIAWLMTEPGMLVELMQEAL